MTKSKSKPGRSMSAMVAGAASTLLPSLAWACPVCATRDTPGVGLLALVLGFIAVPYVTVAVVLKVIGRLNK
jgi:ABC-type Co2+ transport system permease subunit